MMGSVSMTREEVLASGSGLGFLEGGVADLLLPVPSRACPCQLSEWEWMRQFRGWREADRLQTDFLHLPVAAQAEESTGERGV